jgi:hypothetical protein
VLQLLQTRAWELRLRLDGLGVIEDFDQFSRPATTTNHRGRHDVLTVEMGADYFRRLGLGAWRLRGLDRKIGLALAEGRGFRQIKRDLGVGSHRVERVRFEILRDKRPHGRTEWQKLRRRQREATAARQKARDRRRRHRQQASPSRSARASSST